MVWCPLLMIGVGGGGYWTILWAATGLRQWISGGDANFWWEKKVIDLGVKSGYELCQACPDQSQPNLIICYIVMMRHWNCQVAMNCLNQPKYTHSWCNKIRFRFNCYYIITVPRVFFFNECSVIVITTGVIEMICWNYYRFLVSFSFVDCCVITFPIVLTAYPSQWSVGLSSLSQWW